MTAAAVLAGLAALANPLDRDYVARFYAGDLPGNVILGTRMPGVFPLARAHATLPLAEVAALLAHDAYEARMAAATILDVQARRKGADLPGLAAFYLAHLDRLDNWDMVDRAAPAVIGPAALADPVLLDRLAADPRPMARRTAIVATSGFLKRRDASQTLRIGALLADDPHPFVQKALASWLRFAGKHDPAGVAAVVAAHAHRLPRATRRGIES